ncbi:hypothetical protein DH2020_037858 [Rehmannia glutinosa]|uniref:U-box domain-containing protein n=1 Tax=Rehmannia glutinosa TaxID=99300 RepID=A0ABR0V2P7_REHGL
MLANQVDTDTIQVLRQLYKKEIKEFCKRLRSSGVEMVIPPLFMCPISLELFKDPVTLCTGQTYDRPCIQKWLESGNLTCPVTMQKLHDSSMVPNHTLRHLIDEWLCSNTRADTNKISIDSIKKICESDESTLENKIQVLEKVDYLSQELPFKNSCLIKLDFFGLLLEQVFSNNAQGSLRFVEKSLFVALKLMPFSDLETLNILTQESKYEVFLVLFEKGSICIKKSLCFLLEAISSGLQTRSLCEKLGKSVVLSRQIVRLIQQKSDHETVEAGIRALSSLSSIERNRKNLAIEGAVEGLIDYLINADESCKRNLAPMAMSTIEKLLVVESVKDVVINHAFGIKAIVKMVFRVSEHDGSECAINSLLIICSSSENGREKAIVDGVLTQLLLLLQSQSNGRTKTKARMLLKLLRSMWNEDLNNAI